MHTGESRKLKKYSPEKVRISIGTAMQLKLEPGLIDPNFSTAFIMTYHEGGCSANCAFCPQARESSSSPHLLSRIGWPEYKFSDVIGKLELTQNFKRVCIQCLNYDDVVDDVCKIAKHIKQVADLPISVCIHPIDMDSMIRVKDAGIQRIGIAFDACTPKLFDEIKGKNRGSTYTWDNHSNTIETALSIFGSGRVTTHLIIGLGESEKEAVDFLFDMREKKVTVGLFAFTSVRGTSLENHESPDLAQYRRIQIIRYLIANGKVAKSNIHYCDNGEVRLKMVNEELSSLLQNGQAFQVSGCPGCNRPYYNERPNGPMFNFPRKLDLAESQVAMQESIILNDC